MVQCCKCLWVAGRLFRATSMESRNGGFRRDWGIAQQPEEQSAQAINVWGARAPRQQCEVDSSHDRRNKQIW